jgi:hypothetical protein
MNEPSARKAGLERVAPFTLAIAFSAKKQACGPEGRALRGKSIGSVISDCGFRISDFFGFLFQSAFRNRHSAFKLPARPRK